MNYEELIRMNFDEAVAGMNEEMLVDQMIWYGYVSNLPIHLRVVYTIVTMHQQVMNGGFHQYFFNSLGMFAYLSLDSLGRIQASETQQLLIDVLGEVNKLGEDTDVFGKKVFNRKVEKIVNFDEVFGEYLNKCDGYYYESKEDLTSLLGQYLEKAN